jgi:indolepyruvate ferredoxin oxidoreductase, alpha subunit
MTDEVLSTEALMLLGDEAVALGALHAGITAAYAYPGTPATEILEALQRNGGARANWCANEKTAYEAALGMSMAGKRALVSMKHVGLNVAADPFINSAVVAPVGGLVLAVADDPGMHSSQNEQDSRFYADFARVPCLEPANAQEAYDMTREAFEVSERFRVPVVLRLVTRLAHQRSGVEAQHRKDENALNTRRDRADWVLLPSFARRRWQKRLQQQKDIRGWAEMSPHNELTLNENFRDMGVITTGIAQSYFLDVTRELGLTPSHLHIGAYPIPTTLIRDLADHVPDILVIEEGYPYVERMLRGILPPLTTIRGRQSGDLPEAGELNQELVWSAFGLQPPRGTAATIPIPERPPRLCDGCPHIDAYNALNDALRPYEAPVVTSDIGCYTLGALPPYNVGDSCVCMGASIGMGKGAADAGAGPVVAVIGDSTFLHSGVTPLMDAAAANTDMTVLILDNDVVAMTGTQPTVLPPNRIPEIVRGIGVDPEHCHVFESHPRRVGELTQLLRREIAHRGLSVVIVHRECIEALKKDRKARRES